VKLLLSLRRVTLEFGLGRNLILLSPLSGLQTVSTLGASADVGLWFLFSRGSHCTIECLLFSACGGEFPIAAICRYLQQHMHVFLASPPPS
jgi:hypothetical protein